MNLDDLELELKSGWGIPPADVLKLVDLARTYQDRAADAAVRAADALAQADRLRSVVREAYRECADPLGLPVVRSLLGRACEATT